MKSFLAPLSPARLRRSLAVACVLWSVPAGLRAAAPPPRTSPPKIVLKLDDMRLLHPNWQKVLDMVNKRGIKASFGIICNSLENGRPQYYQWIKEVHAAGRVEFWCHGYDHREWVDNNLHYMEFEGPSYEEQKKHLQRCQQLAREKLGFAFASFGAPFNATDEKTAQALRDDVPDFKVWMYGDAQFPMGKTVLVRYGNVNIENPLFVPSTARLAEGMAKHPTAPYFVIQGHPPQWDEKRLAEFETMLDYLISQHAEFVTPAELAASLPPPAAPGPLPPPVPLKAPLTPAAPVANPPAAPAGVPTGGNLVTNGDFNADAEGWALDRIQNTPAEMSVETLAGGKHAVHVKVPQAAEKRYFVQLGTKTTFPLAEGKSYTLSFRAKAEPNAKIVVVFPAAGVPQNETTRQDGIQLKPDWADYQFTVSPQKGSEAARLLLSGLAEQAGDYWFTDLSVRQNQ